MALGAGLETAGSDVVAGIVADRREQPPVPLGEHDEFRCAISISVDVPEEVRIDLDVHLANLGHELGVEVDDPVDPGKGALDLPGLGAEDVEILTEDPHDDGLAGPGQDLPEPGG